MYFSKFPIITYNYYDAENDRTVVKSIPNLMLSFRLSEILRTNGSYFFEYILKDSDRPDIIANKLYGRADLHWLVWLINNVKDPYRDFPLAFDALSDYISTSYPYQAFFVDAGYIDSPARNEFVIGNQISQGTTTQAEIKEWIPTINKLRVDGITGSFRSGATAYSQNQDGVTFGFKLSRIIQDETESLHHFEDSEGNILDPYGYFIDNEQSRDIGVPISGNNKLIDQYINDGVVSQETITIREYEEAKNETNRKIKLLRPEFVDAVLKEFSQLGQTLIV